MRGMPRALRCAVLGLLVLPWAARAAPDFDAWAERVAETRMHSDPQFATQTQFFQGEAQVLNDRRLTPQTLAAQRALIHRERESLKALGRWDPASLTPPQRVSAGIVRWALEQDVAAEPFLYHQWMLDPLSGVQVGTVNFMTEAHPLRNSGDVHNYLVRLRAMGRQMDEALARTRVSQARGIVMPRFIIAKVIVQFQDFLTPPPAKNELVAALERRIAGLPDLSPAQRVAARDEALHIVTQSVLPAWRRGLALMRAQLPRAKDDAGVWRLPHGDRYYAYQLRVATTTDYTPAEIHAIGLKQVARIEAEMDTLLKQLGYEDGSVKERIGHLQADLQPKEEDPRQALLARHTAVLRDAEARARKLFDRVPKAPVEVRREPALTEATASAHYTAPAADGSRPGIFWLPLPGPTYDMVGLRSLIHHETVPGHHFQIALQMEAEGLPHYRRSWGFASGSAFIEGWALYAEQLAADSGWFEGDLVGQLGQLDMALLRARRLVVDTGLHAMRWTRQRAIDYGIPPHEVDRYIVWPGQACAYLLGRLRIEAVRDKARQALGDRFDIRKFHALVLDTGDVPLKVLEDQVNDWITAQKAPSDEPRAVARATAP